MNKEAHRDRAIAQLVGCLSSAQSPGFDPITEECRRQLVFFCNVSTGEVKVSAAQRVQGQCGTHKIQSQTSKGGGTQRQKWGVVGLDWPAGVQGDH